MRRLPRSTRLWFALVGLLALWLVSPAHLWAADVSDKVSVTRSALVFNRATNTFDSIATLKNTSAVTITAPMTLEVSSLLPASVSLANAAGTNGNGRPYLEATAPAQGLAPNAQTTVRLKFANPARAPFSITTRVFGELPSIEALPEVVAQPTQFFINTPTQVRFQSQIPPSANLDTSSVTLRQVDANNVPTGPALCTLADNGVLSNGDDIAGDNVYSCFATLSSATPQGLRLVVQALFSSNPVQSTVLLINIVAPLDQASAQLIVQGQSQAAALAQQAMATMGDNLQARQAAAASIKQLAGVSDAGVSSDDVTIWIKYASGVNAGLMLNPAGTRGSTAARPTLANNTRRPAARSVPPASFPHYRPQIDVRGLLTGQRTRGPAANAATVNFIGNTNVLIWDAYNAQFAPFDEGPDLQALFTGSSCPLYNVTYLKDAQATVASVRNFANYGTVVMVTHGAVDGDGQVVFLTAETATFTAILSHAIDLILGRVTVMGDVFAIRPSFITNLTGTFADSVVYNGSCQSAGNATMANAFTAKGAKTYYGYTKVVNSDFAQSSANQLFASLVTSLKSTGDAFTPIAPKTDPTAPFAVFTQSGDAVLGYTGDLQNGDFEKGNLSSWTAVGDGRVITGLGPFAPTERSYAGLISTGLGFTTSSGAISQNFCLPRTATKLKFDWNFSSEEFIEYCGSSFNDSFRVELVTDIGTTTLMQRTVNGLCAGVLGPTPLAFDASLPICVPDPINVGFGTGGNDCKVWSTGWLSEEIDISGLAATNNGKGVTLRLRATDVGDSIFDSAILLDKITVVRP